MSEMRYIILVFCFNAVDSLFPIVVRERLYNYIPPEDEVTFHLYHRDDLTRDDQLFVGNITSIKESRFNPDIPTKIIIHGWTHGKDVPWLQEMREVMATTGLWNIIVVDWSDLSRVVYIEARLHTYVVAKVLQKLIEFLIQDFYIDLSSIHLIGHSMGAQISGKVGHLVNKQFERKIARITGLDPAAPLYEWPHMESYDDVLDPTDGEFVDVIHTNAKHIGVINPAGHVDFYPNGGKRQKDCSVWACSHLKACEFWTASIRKPDLFQAFPFQSWYEYLRGKPRKLKVYPMGIAANPNMPLGLYYVDPNDDYKMYLSPKTVFSDTMFLGQ